MRSEVRGGEEGKSPNVSPHTELMVGAGSTNIKGKAEIETRKADIISKSVCWSVCLSSKNYKKKFKTLQNLTKFESLVWQVFRHISTVI